MSTGSSKRYQTVDSSDKRVTVLTVYTCIYMGGIRKMLISRDRHIFGIIAGDARVEAKLVAV